MKQVYMQHDGQAVVVANIFCIGRNYAAHAAELGNQIEEKPLVFLKPTSAINSDGESIVLPTFSADVHYETELVLLIGKGGKHIAPDDALAHIAGYGIGLDLTARDIQSQAKAKGLPWTLAKGFDGAACVSHFLPAAELPDPGHCQFRMRQNGEIKQQGDTRLMLFNISYLIAYLSTVFSLSPGDLIFTGTPEGVGRLQSGDVVELDLANRLHAKFDVA
ncbi:fumarylacetoacetate hydrolase family protein [Chitinivorax sp. B]|uniref:fumarylacetoacetate hydrolase family protein n=1 Tax=Chitinivorax sp. B TaxID=2502235 RepID=UPI0010F9F5CC|nr:fumarylacetoacetate hydrolase family protein [Chitinivorax sp. B]